MEYTSTNTDVLCESVTSKILFKDLSEQSDIVIDFSSLKTCLNPKGIEEEIEVRCVLNKLTMRLRNYYFRTSVMKNLYAT